MMLLSASQQASCGVSGPRNGPRSVPCVHVAPQCKAAAAGGGSTKGAAQRRQSVLLRSAESTAAAVTTTEAPAPASTAPALQELTKETFQPFLDQAGEKLVVVDFFTDWCVGWLLYELSRS